MNTTRINKFLASSTGISRRAADVAVEKGRVTINGVMARLGAEVSTEDIVKMDGKLITEPSHHTLIALHKPVGFVCSRRNQGDTPTVYALLPEKFQKLKLVGRLDRDSSGIILLTSDGDFAHRMTHPSFNKVKIYEVTLDQPLQPLHRQMISDRGIALPDGASKFELERLLDNIDTDWRIYMHEGRNRQIRRTFAALGYTVVALHRTNFGNYALGDIKPGEYVELNIS